MLTEQQQAFVEKYLEIRNATEAARIVGYAHPNVQGPRLLKHEEVRDTIRKAMEDAAVTLGISAQWVLKELEDLFMTAKGLVKPKLNSKTGKAIKDEEGNPVYTRDHTTMLKTLELIGKHLGMWEMGADATAENYKAQIDGLRSRFKIVSDNG